MEQLCRDIVKWLREKVYSSGGAGAVFGLSGGVDSAVVAALCREAFGNQNLGVIMPCYSERKDVEHAELLARKLGIPYRIVELDAVFDRLVKEAGEVEEEGDVEQIHLARANIKPRLRMTVLYYMAALKHYRVIGTGNKSEVMIGYFTKYGDGGVDLEPLGDLLKEEVREIARFLKLPREIIEKKPTAGLWKGQTDEGEMGFSYEKLDLFLKGGEVEPSLAEKIKGLIENSAHKRLMPPIFQKKV